jgi:hypothetical protein
LRKVPAIEFKVKLEERKPFVPAAAQLPNDFIVNLDSGLDGYRARLACLNDDVQLR